MKRIFVDLERCMGCKGCEIACAIEHSKHKNLIDAIKQLPPPISRVRVYGNFSGSAPFQCRHCPEPYCYFACIAGAITKASDGTVVLDRDRCVHCYSCVMVCPFGVIKVGEEEKLCAVKCDLCEDKNIPPCVQACPTKAMFYGELEEFLNLVKRRRKKEKCIT